MRAKGQGACVTRLQQQQQQALCVGLCSPQTPVCAGWGEIPGNMAAAGYSVPLWGGPGSKCGQEANALACPRMSSLYINEINTQ